MAKLHYLKFYPESWIAEISLRMCSLAARGLWIDLICHMAKSPEHGVLLTMAGKPISDSQIAAFVGMDQQTVLSALRELEDNRVLSRREDGAVYSRRMVRDHAEYARQVSDGGRGGRPRKGTPKGTPKGTVEGTPEGTPKACVDSRFLVLGSSFSPEGSEPEQPNTELVKGTFEKFWNSYPSKGAFARTQCWTHWCMNNLAASSDKILEGLERWKKSDDWKKDNGKFIFSAKRFLEETRWENAPAAKGPVRPINANAVCSWWMSLPADQKAIYAAKGPFTPEQVDGYARHLSPPEYIVAAWKGVANAG